VTDVEADGEVLVGGSNAIDADVDGSGGDAPSSAIVSVIATVAAAAEETR
jgi:hypothetical protein